MLGRRSGPERLALGALLVVWTGVAAPLTFSHGVSSGDVTATSAVLWTRTDGPAELVAEIAADPAFQRIVTSRIAVTSAERDFTAKLVVEPLEPGQTYYYRWRSLDAVSDTGTFKTAPRRDAAASLRFAFSGDSDGTIVNGAPALNRFEALDAARREDADFFVYLGDTIYADSGFRAPPHPAQTLDEYRQAYKVNRDLPALRELLRSTSIYAIWDDHEVQNDYQGQTVDRTLYANGRRAFLEYMPIADPNLPDRAFCAGDPLLRLVHWGRDIDIIVLDERSCRSASALEACRDASGAPDPAPALTGTLRRIAGLPASPPPGCTETLLDPARTMLGRLQKLIFKSVLLYSKAKFKFVINEVAIQQLFALPYDRWEGYQAERDEILTFIRDNSIKNVIFLTSDLHANILGKVYVDRFAGGDPVADEVITGPIAAATLQREVESAMPGAAGLLNQFAEILGASCRHLDAYSYGVVEVNAANGTATITLKDDTGAVLHDQGNPETACVKTIGP